MLFLDELAQEEDIEEVSLLLAEILCEKTIKHELDNRGGLFKNLERVVYSRGWSYRARTVAP